MEKQIILTSKKLDFLLGNKSVQDRTRPVPTPSAQYIRQGAPGTDQFVSSDTFIHTLQGIELINPILYSIGWLLFTYGMRVSEVLEIQPTHLRNGNKFFIKGKKGSGNRYVNYEPIKAYIHPIAGNTPYLFTGYSRHWVYREFKKLGLILQVQGNNRNAVTHAGRHLVAQELRSSGDDLQSIQGFYQHKNIKSTQHYANKKKSKG